MNDSYIFSLIDIISESIKIPLFLVDSGGNPIYCSSYHFAVDYDGDNYIKLRNAFFKGMQLQKSVFDITVHGLEAVVAEVLIDGGKKLYLATGFFIKPDQTENVCKHWGELGKELLAKNLYYRFEKDKKKISLLLTHLARTIAQKYRMQQLAALFSVIENGILKDRDLNWQNVLEALASVFDADWSCIVITSPQSRAYYLDQDGTLQMREPFYCTLSQWVQKTGKPAFTSDLKNDFRGHELLSLYPQIKCLTSNPFILADGVTGVLHVATKKQLEFLDQALLRHLVRCIHDVSYSEMFYEARNSVIEQALDILLDYLSSVADDENIYPLVLETIAKIVQAKSAALYLLAENGRFNVKAAFRMGQKEQELQRLRIQRTYPGRGVVLKLLPIKPQAGGKLWEVPLLHEEKVIGVIVLKGANLGREQVKFVHRAAALLLLYVQKSKAQKRVNLLESDLIESILTMQETCVPALRSHAEQTATLARQFVQDIGFTEHDAEKIYKAALCHNLGKIRIATQSLLSSLNASDRNTFQKYSKHSVDIIKNIPSLAYLAPILAQLEENVDGSGFPGGLQEDEIDAAARIIRIVSDFVDLVAGDNARLTVSEALSRMEKGAGVQYSSYYFQLFRDRVRGGKTKKTAAIEKAAEKLNLLTHRENEVLRLIAEAKDNKEIAEELFISAKTVKIHVSNILRKLGVKDRTEAAVYYLTHADPPQKMSM